MMANRDVYWRGKCEECSWAAGFTLKYGAVWHCHFFRKANYEVARDHGCSGPKPREKNLSQVREALDHAALQKGQRQAAPLGADDMGKLPGSP